MGEHRRLAAPWPRFWILLNALWAVTPAAILVCFLATRLSGEAAAAGFLLVMILPFWGAAGLLLCVHGVRARSRARWSPLVPPVSFVAAAAMLIGASWIPPTVYLSFNVGRAFAEAQPVGDRDVVSIPNDVHFGGHGRFVREDAERSTADRALLPLGGEHAPWEPSLEVARGTVQMTEGGPDGVDFLLAYPMRDGWWYVYTEY